MYTGTLSAEQQIVQIAKRVDDTQEFANIEFVLEQIEATARADGQFDAFERVERQSQRGLEEATRQFGQNT